MTVSSSAWSRLAVSSLLVSIAGSSTSVSLLAPGWITDMVTSSGISPYVVTALACTSSTSPTSSGSVPGRAFLPSALSGSGLCSSWYSIADHVVHVPSVRVRTRTLIWSSFSSWPWPQVTPTAP